MPIQIGINNAIKGGTGTGTGGGGGGAVFTDVFDVTTLSGGGGGGSWWDGSGLNRVKITFDNSASGTARSDFPVAVSFTPADVDFAKIKAAGADIRFVDDDDATELDFEIED